MARIDARKEAAGYVERLQAVPPWYTNKLLCIRVIGERYYEELSREVQENLTSQAPLVKGVKEGLETIIARARSQGIPLQPALVTDRKEKGMDAAKEYLHQHGMYDWFNGEFHRTEGADSKVPYCIGEGMRAHADDDPRFLTGGSPEFLKLLVALARGQKHDFTITRMRTNHYEKVVHVMQLVEEQNITYVTGFPKAAEAIMAHAAQTAR